MKVQRIILPVCAENCYIVMNEQSLEAVIIDPGSDPEKIKEIALKIKAKPVAILLTHGHFDHADAAEEIASYYKVLIYASELEQQTLEDSNINLSEAFTGKSKVYYADLYLKDQEEFDLAGIHFRCISTPGHTPGGCCYYVPYEKMIFTGDTLFNSSVGRTDFPGGSMSELVRSCKEKLLILPGDTLCYPGHDTTTTLEDERMYNPYLA